MGKLLCDFYNEIPIITKRFSIYTQSIHHKNINIKYKKKKTYIYILQLFFFTSIIIMLHDADAADGV